MMLGALLITQRLHHIVFTALKLFAKVLSKVGTCDAMLGCRLRIESLKRHYLQLLATFCA